VTWLHFPQFKFHVCARSGQTVLHLAAVLGHLEIADLYLTYHQPVLDLSNSLGQVPLHLACQKGQEDLVRLFLESGASVNLADLNGDVPLHSASAWGQVNCIELLIQAGASYAVKNNQGWSPSEYAFSFDVQTAFQEVARSTFEANKRERAARKLAAGLGRKKGSHGSKDKPLPPDFERSGSSSTVTPSLPATNRSTTPVDFSTSRRVLPPPKSPIVEQSVQKQIHADMQASPFPCARFFGMLNFSHSGGISSSSTFDLRSLRQQ
jgi:ankyrin repeat protein